MNKLLIICFVGVALCVSLLTKEIIECIETKRMVKRALENCFKAVEEKEVNKDVR